MGFFTASLQGKGVGLILVIFIEINRYILVASAIDLHVTYLARNNIVLNVCLQNFFSLCPKDAADMSSR